MLRTPRIAYEDGHLLFVLRGGEPIRVPVSVVECFFFGHADSQIHSRGSESPETKTIVVRLAESAGQWRHQQVKAELGHWCDGYITILGTHCEPIDAALLQRLNARLVEVHRIDKQQQHQDKPAHAAQHTQEL
jgi:hypothetical protein